MTPKTRNIFIILILLFSIGISKQALAVNAELFRPIADNKGTFRLDGSKTLKPYQFSAGLFESYLENALVFRNFSFVPTSRQVVDRMLTTHVVGEIGLHDRISAGFHFPFMYDRYVIPTTLSTQPRYQNSWAIGDVQVHGKFRILKAESFPVGISVVPFVVAPSGSQTKYTGDRNVDVGGKAVFDWEYKNFFLAFNLGAKWRTKPETIQFPGVPTQLNIGSELLYGLGARYEVYKNRIQIVADIVGSTRLKRFFMDEATSPVDILGGLRFFFLDRRLALNVGGGAGLNRGYGSPKVRAFVGLTFQHPGDLGEESLPKKVTVEKIVTEREVKMVILKGILFDTAKVTLKPKSFPILDQGVEMIMESPETIVRVEGHTDSRGSEQYNQKLSEGRAGSVKDYFIKNGVPADRLTVVGEGESDPIASNKTREGMAQNRRVELHFMVQEITERIIEPIQVEELPSNYYP